VTTTTHPAKYRLRAITDEAAARTHLGAVEKANVAFCGAKLIVKGDERFGGRYADKPYTAAEDLTAIDCRACQRTAYWQDRKGATWTAPAPKASTAKAGR
jgi:hypothetical protein